MVSAKSCPLTVGLRISRRTPASPCICMFHDHAEMDSWLPHWMQFNEPTIQLITLWSRNYLHQHSTPVSPGIFYNGAAYVRPWNKCQYIFKRFISCNIGFLVTLGWNRKSTAEESLGKHNEGIWNVLLLNNGWVLIFFVKWLLKICPYENMGFFVASYHRIGEASYIFWVCLLAERWLASISSQVCGSTFPSSSRA